MVGNQPLPVLAERRKELGLTQKAFGEEVGVTDVTVSRWETGVRKIDDDYLPKVAERTGLSWRALRPDLAALAIEPVAG